MGLNSNEICAQVSTFRLAVKCENLQKIYLMQVLFLSSLAIKMKGGIELKGFNLIPSWHFCRVTVTSYTRLLPSPFKPLKSSSSNFEVSYSFLILLKMAKQQASPNWILTNHAELLKKINAIWKKIIDEITNCLSFWVWNLEIRQHKHL